MSKTLEAIKYDRQSRTLEILDQLKLPHVSQYVPIPDTKAGFDAIKTMTVRGAPAIAIVAALSLAVELNNTFIKQGGHTSAQEVAVWVSDKLKYLVESRPTAVNLSRAAHDITAFVGAKLEEDPSQAGSQLAESVISVCEDMLEADVSDNTAIGENGANWTIKELESHGLSGSEKFSALTICNTGSLATAGYGTALGIIRSLFKTGRLDHTYACETRPYNQGSRLTAYELVYDQIPATLITDNMATSLLSRRASNTAPRGESQSPVRLIVVGADRVAANGDTANKIGTFQLAALADHFRNDKAGDAIRFVVAAPTTSIDMNTATGDDIVIEERPQNELVQVKGPVVDPKTGKVPENPEDQRHETVNIAAPGIDVWNPAFDVTPHKLIDAIVTEKGVAVKDEQGNFDLKQFF